MKLIKFVLFWSINQGRKTNVATSKAKIYFEQGFLLKSQWLLNIFLFALCVSPGTANAQSNHVSLNWSTDQALESSIYGIPTVLDSEESLFRCGTENSTGGNIDAKIQKWDSEGVKEWETKLNINSGIYQPTRIIVEGSDLYVCGIVRTSRTSDANLFIAKVEEGGSVEWFEVYENSSDDLAGDILWDQGDQGIYFCGSTDRNGDYDLMLGFVDTDGDLQWTVTRDYNGNVDGAAGIEYSGSNLILHGSSQTSSTNWDITSWLYSSNGAFISEERNTGLTGASEKLKDGAINNGNFLLTGTSTSGGNTDFKVACLDISNNYLWQSTYDKNGGNDQGTALISSTNAFVATGFVTGSAGTTDILVRKYNLSGTLLWSSEFDFAGSDDKGVDIIEDNDNNYLVLTDVNTGSQVDVYLYYIDGTSGSRLWMEKISESASISETGISIESDLSGTVWVSYLSNEKVITKTYAYAEMDFYNGAEPHSTSSMYISNSGHLRDASENSITSVKYYSFGLELDYYFTNDNFSIGLNNYTDDGVANDSEQRIDVNFVNKEEASVGQLEEFQQEADFNFYIGNNSYEGEGTFEVLSYPSLYENIDAFIHSNSEGFKMTFVLNDEADLSNIELNIDGSSSVYLDGNNLNIETIEGAIEWQKPKSYAASSSPIGDNCIFYSLEGDNLTFTSNGCDLVYPYVIEIKKAAGQSFPASAIDNLEWSTFWGGNDDDVCFDAEATSDGDLFIAGFTDSQGLPSGAGINPTAVNGDRRAFIVKFDHNAVAQWGTVIAATGAGREAIMKGVGVYDNFSSVTDPEVHFVGEYSGSMSLFKDPLVPASAFQQTTSAISDTSNELFFGSLRANGTLLVKSPFGGGEIEKIHAFDISDQGLMYFGGSTEGGSAINSSSSSPPTVHDFPVFDPADGSFYEEVHPNAGNEKRGFVTAVDLSTYLLAYSSLITKDPTTTNTPFEAILDIELTADGGAYCGKGLTYARLGRFNQSKFATGLNQYKSEWPDKTYFSSVVAIGPEYLFMGMDEGTLDPLLKSLPPGSSTYQSTTGEAFLVMIGYEQTILWDSYFGLNSDQKSIWENPNHIIPVGSTIDDLTGRGKLTYSPTNRTFYAAASASGNVETQSQPGLFFEANNSSGSNSNLGEDLYLAAFSSNMWHFNNFRWGTMFGSDGNGPWGNGVEQLCDVLSYDVGADSYVTTVAALMIGNTSPVGGASTTQNVDKYPLSNLNTNSWFRSTPLGSFENDVMISRFKVTDIRQGGLSVEENLFADVFRIFPNPTSDGFFLEGLSDEKIHKIELFDTNGKLIIEKEIKTEELSIFIRTSHLKVGLYILKVNDRYNQKLVKL